MPHEWEFAGPLIPGPGTCAASMHRGRSDPFAEAAVYPISIGSGHEARTLFFRALRSPSHRLVPGNEGCLRPVTERGVRTLCSTTGDPRAAVDNDGAAARGGQVAVRSSGRAHESSAPGRSDHWMVSS